ncbi:hypothetical protein CMV_023222 [Castanea mollissima]|uniref:Uncharacterized protein n=1 Tax=Castanea mollissima TaxID=60419 RepID=A0A8J4QPV7_9ROSI|nr:hypothetical protein CMV_023222 [Castanea mollissima]
MSSSLAIGDAAGDGGLHLTRPSPNDSLPASLAQQLTCLPPVSSQVAEQQTFVSSEDINQAMFRDVG